MDKNQQKLIILQGAGNAGKTTTLRSVIETLQGSHNYALVCDDHARGKDRRVVLKSAGGVRVGICTAGDTHAIIEGNYRFFLHHSCDIMITACSRNLSSGRSDVRSSALIGFASGYWESEEVHYNDDSTHVKLIDILHPGEIYEKERIIIGEILKVHS